MCCLTHCASYCAPCQPLLRALPTELHHRVTRAGSTCSDASPCSPRAEMGTNLPSVDLGAGRTAVAVRVGLQHTCALLVRLGALHTTSRKPLAATERELFIDNLLVRIHCIIVTIRWAGLAPWEFESRYGSARMNPFSERLPPSVFA